MTSQQQSVQVTQVVQNRGCLSGCVTIFAIALVVGAIITYWYVAVPVAVLAAAGFAFWWYQQRHKLPEPKPGPQDPWLNRVATRLQRLGLAEATRNTGAHLEGVPMEGDLCVEGEGMRLWVNVFREDAFATDAAAKLKAKPTMQEALTRGASGVVSQGRVIYVAAGIGQSLSINRFESAIEMVSKVPFVESSEQSIPHQLEERSTAPPQAHGDALEQLRKLGELRDAGVVTAEEFEAKKAELLERL